jgi:polyvinyl alcohol dehydrogenase (cytochrome)
MAVLTWPAAASADSWPVYGKDLSNSRDAKGDGPAPQDVVELQKAWSISDPDGDFTGTPVVAAGTMVAGSFVGKVYAVDAVTGAERWTADVGGPVNGSAAIDPNAPGGGIVYMPVANVGSPRLVALSLADGSVLWDTVLTDQDRSSVYSSPMYWDGTVYIGTSGPNLDDSTARGTVVALDALTGAVRWRTFTVPPGYDGGPVWSTPAIDAATDRLYVGTGNAYHGEAAETTDAMLALDMSTGEILDHFQATPDDTFAFDNPVGPDLDFGASPNLITDQLGRRLVGEGAKSGIYWALDRETMEPVWNTTTGPSGPIVGGIIGSTAYDGARIYGTNVTTAAVWALDTDGAEVWRSSDAGGGLDFSPVAVGNGVVYTADPSGTLTARDAATGERLRRFSLGGATFGGMSVVGGAVYVSVGTGPLPEPAPQTSGSGEVIAFGDTSRSGPADTAGGVEQGGTESRKPRPRIKLKAKPKKVRAGVRKRFRFRTRANGLPVDGARVRFAGKRARAGEGGRATIRTRLTPGTHRARAVLRGFRSGRAVIRARSQG